MAACGDPGRVLSLEGMRGRLRGRAERLSRPLVERLARAGLTPDALTVLGLVVCALAAGLLAGGSERAAGVVWLAGSALDLLDGALARASGTVARRGAFLDSTLDRVGEGLLLTAAVYLFAATGRPLAAALAAWAMLASFLVSYARARAEALGVRCDEGLATRAERVVILGLGLLLEQLALAVAAVALLATFTGIGRVLRARAALR